MCAEAELVVVGTSSAVLVTHPPAAGSVEDTSPTICDGGCGCRCGSNFGDASKGADSSDGKEVSCISGSSAAVDSKTCENKLISGDKGLSPWSSQDCAFESIDGLVIMSASCPAFEKVIVLS